MVNNSVGERSTILESQPQMLPQLCHFSSPKQPNVVLYTLILVQDVPGVGRGECPSLFPIVGLCKEQIDMNGSLISIKSVVCNTCLIIFVKWLL